jgi:hypothetical protein
MPVPKAVATSAGIFGEPNEVHRADLPEQIVFRGAAVAGQTVVEHALDDSIKLRLRIDTAGTNYIAARASNVGPAAVTVSYQTYHQKGSSSATSARNTSALASTATATAISDLGSPNTPESSSFNGWIWILNHSNGVCGLWRFSGSLRVGGGDALTDILVWSRLERPVPAPAA